MSTSSSSSSSIRKLINAIQQPIRQPRLNNEEKQQIIQALLSKKVCNARLRGVITKVSNQFGYSRKTIGKLWNKALWNKEANKPYYVPRLYNSCGRKKVLLIDPFIWQAQPIGNRTCIRDVATCLGISSTTTLRLIKKGEIKPHSNPLHPSLTEGNKLQRLSWVISLLQYDSIPHNQFINEYMILFT